MGLGIKFLRHADRCKILLHMVNMSSLEGNDPINDYKVIRNEIEKYSKKLANKIEIVAASKMDMPDAKDNLEKFKKAYPNILVYPICSLTMSGVNELLNNIGKVLETAQEENLFDENEFEEEVYIKFKKEKPYTITKENDIWVIRGKEIERIFKMTKFEEDEGAMRFARILKAMGVEDELASLGAKSGDDVAINDYLFTYKG